MSAPSIAIVGAGDRGTKYGEYALHFPEQTHVVAVAEPRLPYQQRMAAAHHIPQDHVYDDWHALADQPRLADAVIIATPDARHAACVLAFAEQGYHILLEKPMAPNEADCRRIVDAISASGVLMAVCHVNRYSAYTRKIKSILDSGSIGEVVTIQHLEPVGYWHQAHSFVRGNWRKEAESSSMLLAKGCHDIDWIRYIMGKRCVQVSSFGSLNHFRPANKPPGAADRCLDCALEQTCTYSASQIYLRLYREGRRGWPLDVVTPHAGEEALIDALRTGPYGRCVYDCDNDVVDNQVVNLRFEDDTTAAFTMTAFTPHVEGGHRKTRIFGTEGELDGADGVITWERFSTGTSTTIDLSVDDDNTVLTNHGGGDVALMEAFLNAVRTGDASHILSNPGETLESHLIVFAAETSRREGRTVDIDVSA